MKKITEENVFKNQRYHNIFSLILNADVHKKKIKFVHFKYVLVKKHGIDLKNKKLNQNLRDFFRMSNKEKAKIMKLWETLYNHSEKTNYDKNLIKKIKTLSEKTYLDQMKKKGLLTDKTKFSSPVKLSEALKRLRELNLIKRKKDKKGFPYYTITPYGLFSYDMFYLNHKVKEKIPMDNSKILNEINFVFRDTINQIKSIMRKYNL